MRYYQVMKYLVFSDLHGSRQGLELLQVAVKEERPDMLLCLGDILSGAYDGDRGLCIDYLKNNEVPLLGVRGNCDAYFDASLLGIALPETMTLYFHNHRLLLAHAPFIGEKAGDVVIYGHTHRKMLYEDQDIITLNPGSIGKPRDGAPGIAIMDEEGIFLKDAYTLGILGKISW